jgi:hypothetical protein
MNKKIIKESVSLNNSIILEKGEEIIIFNEKEYNDFITKNNIVEKRFKEEEAYANKSKNDDSKSTDSDKTKTKDDDDKDKDDKKEESINNNDKAIKEQDITNYDNSSMTTGEQLINKFGLNELPNVYICKITGSSIPIFHIVFDSYRENLNLNKSSINSKHNVTLALSSGKFLNRSSFIKLRDYNGSISNGLFVINDLAGSNMGNIEF